MKPIDDDANDDESEVADNYDDVVVVKRRRKTHRRRSRGKELATTTGFVAWVIFTVIWLFFFASGYTIFENIAIVFIALLVFGALVTLLWIPSIEGRRPQASAVSGFVWIIFLIVWIIFFAGDFGFYENIGIAIASLIFIGLLNMLLWMPRHGESGDARVSGSAALIWMIFIVLWLPFANDFSQTIYSITFYQSIAISVASLLLMLIVVISPWWGDMQISTGRAVSTGKRPKATVGFLYLWIFFLVLWMWIFADSYTGYQNVSAVLISFAIFCLIVIGIWYSWARTQDEGPESWFSIGLTFAWVIILGLWVWFFADNFDAYQNLAVFLASLVGVAGIAGAIQWQKLRDFESLDWED